MINREDFWVPPGCLPGMSPEQTKTYLRELEEKCREQKTTALNDAIVADARHRVYSPRTGVDATALEAWESEQGVRLPRLLREVLGWQNGGHVRNTSIEIHSLSAIVPVDDDFWRFEEIPQSEAADQSLVFVFGTDTQIGGRFLLKFNARGPTDQVQTVYAFFNDGTGATLIADSLEEFLVERLAFSTEPSVDWAQPNGSRLEIRCSAASASEIDAVDGGRGRLEQVLAASARPSCSNSRHREFPSC